MESVAGSSPIRRIREEQGLSQRLLAERTNISRGRLRRLEGNGFGRATLDELARISKTLGIQVERFLRCEKAFNHGAHFLKAGEASLQIGMPEVNCKIDAFLPSAADLFIGKLYVAPKKIIPAGKVPHAQQIFLLMLLGALRIEAFRQTYEIRVGESIYLRDEASYSIENPLLRDSVALLVTTPTIKL